MLDSNEPQVALNCPENRRRNDSARVLAAKMNLVAISSDERQSAGPIPKHKVRASAAVARHIRQ